MNFDLTEDQTEIKRTAREFLADRYGSAVLREGARSERGFTDEQWAAIAELGWPGVLAGEEHGGLGLGAVELTVISEELGYALAPSPLLPSIWAASLLAATVDEDGLHGRWLGPLASGEARATLSLANGPAAIEIGGDRVSGELVAVPHAADADVLVASSGDRLAVIELGGDGVTTIPRTPLDPTRKLFSVELDGAPVSIVEAGDTAAELTHAGILTSVAAECVGIAQRTLEMAVAYASDRKQFGRPIGSYQAIAHRCSQMLLETEGARSLAYGAAYAVDREPDLAPRAAAMAKAYAGDAGVRVSKSALQVHGGIGFTWEHDLHFFLKRATVNARAFGNSAWHLERVVSLAGL